VSFTQGQTSQKRPWLAAVLTLLAPGLGHAYLRLWGRGLFWLVLTVGAWWLLIPDLFSATSFDELLTVTDDASMAVNAALAGVSALCIVDAYLMALSLNATQTQPGTEMTVRPHSGNELDEDLDFCHWCTTPIERGPTDTDQTADTDRTS
jgi:hypothetical protein